MGGTPAQRTVEVCNPRVGVVGSGSIIAPGLVLTAYHVVCLKGDNKPVIVRALEGGCQADAEVVWSDAELDAVLLRTDRARIGTDLTAVRWGQLTCEHAAVRPVCTMTGFPRAMSRLLTRGDQETAVDDPKTVDGRIKPGSGQRSDFYVFEIGDAPPGSHDLWKGMSGAAVFCDDLVVGLAARAAEHWHGQMLLVVPADQLLAATGFAETITNVTGMPPQLRPADLNPLLTDLRDAQLSSSHLLNPHSRVVPLSGTVDHLRALDEWCLTSRATDVAVITGTGGIGKTRLASELLHRLSHTPRRQDAWIGGFLADNPRRQPPEYVMLTTARRPLLIVVDYAETRLDQVRHILDLLAAPRLGGRIRLLLIARGRDNWWPPLRRAHQGTAAMGVGLSVEATATDALKGIGTARTYAVAKTAFTECIGLLQQAGLGEEWPVPAVGPGTTGMRHLPAMADKTVIALHMAALADVLAKRNPALAVFDRPMDVLLAHEENYWRRVAAARMPNVAFDIGLVRSMVAVQRLTGAQTRRDARAAVSAGFEVHHHGLPATTAPQAGDLAAYEEILTALYPSGSGARWGAMGPDLLGAALVAEVEQDSGGEFIERLLPHPHLTNAQRYQGLTVITRASATQPELVTSAARAVAAAPALLLPMVTQRIATQAAPESARDLLLNLQNALIERASEDDDFATTFDWAAGAVTSTLTQLRPADHRRSRAAPRTVATEPPAKPTMSTAEPDPQDPLKSHTPDEAEVEPAPSAPTVAARPAKATTDALPLPVHTRVVIHAPRPGVMRILSSSVAVMYLALMGYVSGRASFASSDPSFWGLCPAVVGSNLVFAFFFGHWRLRLGYPTVLVPLTVWALTVATGGVYAESERISLSIPVAVVWSLMVGGGMVLLTWTVRSWTGQIEVVERSDSATRGQVSE
ncbi:trypsin-like peptidase domain-containing protein [Kitasatospora sp. NPDC058170]|uniref:trypsin-like peptidase domain-containing protein n=1 Tax=Kitasatospora sp. NPDC058170 TaxID=3346364 RepID=UPI0036DA04A4